MISITSFSQIKVFPSGKISFGNTVDPGNKSVNYLFKGSYSAFCGNTSFSTCAVIKGNTGYSSTSSPDYTFWGDLNTGIYHSSADKLGISTNGVERFRIDDYGRVRFKNTDITSYGLIVQAYANVSTSKMYQIIYNGSPTYYAIGNGNVYASGYFSSSDINLKENIQDIEGALDKVRNLRGVSYQRKADTLADASDTLTVISTEEKPVEIGVIAQEVEEIVPELVVTQPEGLKYVAYQNMVGLLIEAIKDLDQEVTELKSQLESSYKNSSINGNEFDQGKSNNYLKQNIPNPYSNETEIEYCISENNTNAQILFFDISGKLIRTYQTNTGMNTLRIKDGEFIPGMYYYSLVIDGKEYDTKKMILIN